MLFFTSGALLDVIGPRLLCMLGASVYALGCFLLAVSSSRGPNLYILGYSLLSWGGPALFLSFIPLSSLYGRWSNTVICTINSAFDATPYLFSVRSCLSLLAFQRLTLRSSSKYALHFQFSGF